MQLLKDLGMRANLSGTKHRVGLYKCPSCNVDSELYTHNVKRQEKRAASLNKASTCFKCMMVERNTKGKPAIKKIKKIKPTIKIKPKPVLFRSKKYRHVAWSTKDNKWCVDVPVPNKKGKKEYLGLFDCEEKAQDSIIEYLSHFDNTLTG